MMIKTALRAALAVALSVASAGCATSDRWTRSNTAAASASSALVDPVSLADARQRAERRYALDIENLAYVPGPERIRAEAAALVRYEAALADIDAGRLPGADYPMPTEQIYARVASNSRYVAVEPVFQFEPVDLASLDPLGAEAGGGLARAGAEPPDARDRLAGGPVRLAESPPEAPEAFSPAATSAPASVTYNRAPTVVTAEIAAPAPLTVSQVAVGGPLEAPSPTSSRDAVLVSTQITLSGADVFASGAATPTARALSQIESAVRAYGAFDRAIVFVHGHADSIGGDALNLSLSRARADAVAAKLIAAGLPADRITVDGFGETRPVADNATAAGRARNRRVEIIIQPVSVS